MGGFYFFLSECLAPSATQCCLVLYSGANKIILKHCKVIARRGVENQMTFANVNIPHCDPHAKRSPTQTLFALQLRGTLTVEWRKRTHSINGQILSTRLLCKQ